VGLRWRNWAYEVSWFGGLILLWGAAVLTLVTGWDYLRKAWPHLQGET